MACSSNCASFFRYCNFCFLLLIVVWSRQSDGFGTFGFDIHHRYSDPVKGILDLRGLPEKGTVHYYAAMAHRDGLFRGRNLAATNVGSSPLTFAAGNDTYRIGFLGFLHYANVSVGTPGLWFLVALDTGSDLFWLPCDCTSCVHSLVTPSGQEADFNIYNPNTSSTSMKIPCNSTFCTQQRRQCSSMHNTCPYKVQYLSNGTSSTGLLIEDVLHLTTDDSQRKTVDAWIKFGCGINQTGSFLEGIAPNGLFGLGMANISVPSILAREGLTANSFSMCFGPDGIGRISFGDTGSPEQGETPFNLNQSHPTYNVSMTQISVGDNVTDLNFNGIFDSGTSFTYLGDPAYTIISESFNSQIKEKRISVSRIPFEYCYGLSANQTSFYIPLMNLTMKGGKQFYVTDPTVTISLQNGHAFCLGMVKSGDINIVGQNFMTGYRIVFNHEKMVLGWEASNCYDVKNSSSLTDPPALGGRNDSPSPSPSYSLSAPPPAKPEVQNDFPSPSPSEPLPAPPAAEAESNSGVRNGSLTINPSDPVPVPSNDSPHSNSFVYTPLGPLLFFSLYNSYCLIIQPW